MAAIWPSTERVKREVSTKVIACLVEADFGGKAELFLTHFWDGIQNENLNTPEYNYCGDG
jgi:hypothetical protein